MLPPLNADSLYVFAFGPGTGELVAVRAPPDEWLIVDGCSVEGASYAVRLLEHYRARPRILVLTHPHLDHARGIADVIDAATAGPPIDWPTLGLVLPPSIQGAGDLADLARAYQGGVAEEAVSAILDRWERHPPCRWDLHVNDLRPFGEAELRVASPSEAARAKAQQRGRGSIDPNAIASVLLVSWGPHRVVLGSDLVDRDPEGWAAALATVPALQGPSLLKVAHHGSLHAQHDALFAPDVTTTLMATPFARHRLPRFDDDQGADWLLDRSPELLLTGLPRAYAEQGEQPATASRASLAAAGRAGVRRPPVPGFPDCGCVVELRRDGTSQKVMGSGSVVVTP